MLLTYVHTYVEGGLIAFTTMSFNFNIDLQKLLQKIYLEARLGHFTIAVRLGPLTLQILK